ncbi:MAG: tyrosine-type recombinase/integrase [Bacillota bacterium]
MQRIRRRNKNKINHGITVNEALDVVIRIYESEGYRSRTINDYRTFWAEFISIVNKQLITEVYHDDLHTYIHHLLHSRKLSPVTVNIRLSAIRAMLNRLYKEEIISINPVEKIRKLKTDQQRIFTLTDHQIRRLFSVIDTKIALQVIGTTAHFWQL